jgi:F0F1-type ATP synthase membrane subunit b/b'
MLGGKIMEKVISLLFDIERKANQIIERANIEKNELYEDNEKLIKKMEADIAEENNAKINALMTQAEKEIEQEKQQLIESSDKQLKVIVQNYETNHDAMVDKVFLSIIQI